MRLYAFAAILTWLGWAGHAGAEAPAVEKGTVRFKAVDDQKNVPERYRLEPRDFDFEMVYKRELVISKADVFHVTFPSPLPTACKENNTVHAEYYRPRGKGPMPAVIVLDITGGDQSLSRTISTVLAERGIAALFVQMAYYGPRRPPGSNLRMLMPDVQHSMAAVRQTVLDLRCAGAWLESRPEVDRQKLAILGTSLGSFMAALTAEMEPRFRRVVVLLGGGGLVDAYYDDERVVLMRKTYEALGGSREKLQRLIAPADPLTCAANLKDRKVLMIAASRDEIVPPKAAEALWKASGQQKIVWYDTTHYGAALYFAAAMKHVTQHLQDD